MAGMVEVATAPEQGGPPVPQALMEVLPDGFRIEYCPAARTWWGAAARSLGEGALVGIDYGLTREERFSAERGAGTARAYFQHTVNDRLLQRPGEQDLTAHVDFTALIEEGEATGLNTEFLLSQERFLMRVVGLATDRGDLVPWTEPRRRALSTLTHPSHLGHVFRALCQIRNRQGGP